MTYVRSFSHVERELMHHYRDQLNHAESEEDIKKFFARTIQSLLSRAMDDTVPVHDTDAVLKPGISPYYEISERLADTAAFQELRKHSDINAVLKRFAEPAVKHYRHLLGHPEKTDSKIRHNSQ
jgi:glycyl-tRNA synthetase beta subunit